MEELLRKGPLRPVHDAEGCGDLMAQDHPRIMTKMLDDDVLSLGQARPCLRGAEGDEGVYQSLLDFPLSLPFPEIVIVMCLTGQRRKGAICHLKGGDFRAEADS